MEKLARRLTACPFIGFYTRFSTIKTNMKLALLAYVSVDPKGAHGDRKNIRCKEKFRASAFTYKTFYNRSLKYKFLYSGERNFLCKIFLLTNGKFLFRESFIRECKCKM